MRKIKLQMQVTLDGFVGGLHGELDWMTWEWDQSLKDYASRLTRSADTFLLGRKTGEGMAVYWPTVASNPQSKEEDLWMAKRLNRLPKLVFSRTVSSINWTNATVATHIESEVKRLKDQPGKDILLYGGAGIVASFIQKNLIDEYHLFINPVAIGKGMPIFNTTDRCRLKLLHSTPSSCGIVVNCYVPDQSYS